MTLRLHRAGRPDLLADALGSLLATPVADPFLEEVVVVPARGVERWLTQRLSHRLGEGPRGGDGVCAGVRFLSPRSLVSLLLGRERDDPWDPDRLVWPLLATIDESLDERWCRPLAVHLGADRDGVEEELRRGRRYSVARRLADLFASYAVQRPALLTDWAAGRATDGAGATLPDDLAWQPPLWRALLERVDSPAPDERDREVAAAIRAGAPLALPARLSLFGHTRLVVGEVELLRAVAERREVHLWLPQVSGVLWAELARELVPGWVRRREDRSVDQVRHPLLASLGRDSRELQRSLTLPDAVDATGAVDAVGPEGMSGAPGAVATATGASGTGPPPAAETGDAGERDTAGRPGAPDTSEAPDQTTDPETSGGPEAPATLLGWLQHDLRANAEPDVATRAARPLAADDQSVQVHACHGRGRQVDVLREVLAGLLQDDPTLEPRDIVVMCPDIEEYAPLVSAGFGLGDDTRATHPAHRLRVRLADRGLASTNPLLAVAGHLVEIAGGRATASDVLDLFGEGPVRRRFGFADDDLDRLGRWVGESVVRWGLSARHRAPYHLEGVGQNTWREGLDRILLGVAAAEEHTLVGQTLPVDDVGSGAVDLAGRLAEALDRIERAVDTLRAPGPVERWTAAMLDAVSSLTRVAAPEAWQVSQLERELRGVAAAGSGTGVELGLADVRSLLGLRLAGRPTRANFRTGTLTVCTMVPMRSVPHRVVCLLGLDDGAFPRTLSPDGDDVLARDPLTGERDVRSEDRQLFLDALLAAGERLVVTYTGASEHTGQQRPPAVPVGELLDALDRTADGDVRERVVVRHPLQPFDERNFTGDRGGADASLAGRPDGKPFSFDTAALDAAIAARRQRPREPFLPAALPAVAEEADVSITDLVDFYKNPARALLRRLDVATPREAEDVKDAIPIDLDNLERWQIGDRVIQAILDGADDQQAIDVELSRGELPPGELAPHALGDILKTAQQVLETSQASRVGDPRTTDVLVEPRPGRRLVGAVGGRYGDTLVRLTYSRLQAKHLLPAWVDLLALQTAEPDTELVAELFGRADKRGRGARYTLGPVDPAFARAHLATLAEVRDLGQTRPAPLPLATGRAWAEGAERSHGNADYQARRAWEGSDRSPVPGDRDDAAFVRVLGPTAPYAALDGLATLGNRIWSPLLQHERVP